MSGNPLQPQAPILAVHEDFPFLESIPFEACHNRCVSSNLFLVVGVLLFFGAAALCFWERLHPAAAPLMALTVGLLGAVSFQVCVMDRLFDAFVPFAKSGGDYGRLPGQLSDIVLIGQSGLVLLLAVCLVATIQSSRRREALPRHSRLTSMGTAGWVATHLLIILSAAGLLAFYENGSRSLALSMATEVPVGARDLPRGFAQLFEWTRAQDQMTVGGLIGFHDLAGRAGAMALGAVLIATALLLWAIGRIEPTHDSTATRSTRPGSRTLPGLAIVALLVVGALVQVWRLEEIKSWIPVFRETRTAVAVPTNHDSGQRGVARVSPRDIRLGGARFVVDLTSSTVWWGCNSGSTLKTKRPDGGLGALWAFGFLPRNSENFPLRSRATSGFDRWIV